MVGRHSFLTVMVGVSAIILSCDISRAADAAAKDDNAKRLKVSQGFSISVFATGIDDARMMVVTSRGDLIVSTPDSSKLRLVMADADGDGRSDGVKALLGGLKRPHGVALHEGWLYVAETDAVGRVRFDPVKREVQGKYTRLVKGLPAKGGHLAHAIKFGPDGALYLTIGSSCNVCLEKDERRATMMRFNADGTGGEIYATGLRNSVGFDWSPADGKLYAADNGRDWLGDNFPPCELNVIEKGGFYGWPYANGAKVPDPKYGRMNPDKVARSRPPVYAFGAHVAPLGMTFLRSEALPLEYRGVALVALHGSWNRSTPSGYKVVMLRWQANGEIAEQEFITGFEKKGAVVGRPVDVAEAPDGAIYVSDDHAGIIYRVIFEGPKAPVYAMR